MDKEGFDCTVESALNTAQWFGSTVEAFLSEIENEILDLIEDALEEVEQKILEEDKLNKGITRQNMQISKYNMHCLMSRDLQESFYRLETYYRHNIFKIPENVPISDDKIDCETPCTKEMEEALDMQLCDLREKIKQSRYFCLAIDAEEQEIDLIQEEMDKMLSEIESSQESIQGQAVVQRAKDASQFATVLKDLASKDCLLAANAP